MKCKRCQSITYVKAGFVEEKQRYKCKECGYFFTDTVQGVSLEKKRLAIHLYLEGLGFRSIGRIINVSNVAVLNWVRNLSEIIEQFNKEFKNEKAFKEPIKIIELDEMWHYIGKKNKKRGSGWLLLEIAKSLDGKSAVVEKKLAESSGITLKI
jgi:transposase-like protein